jgi:hypothetical protein
MSPSLKFTAIAADLHAEPLGDHASHYLFVNWIAIHCTVQLDAVCTGTVMPDARSTPTTVTYTVATTLESQCHTDPICESHHTPSCPNHADASFFP